MASQRWLNPNGGWKSIILTYTTAEKNMSLPKLLLLHGALGSSAQFELLKTFLHQDFEILAPDFPGHGGREIPWEEFSLPSFAADIFEFLNSNDITCIDIFGYSMGGYAALWMAKYSPGRVNRIFTLATKTDWNEISAQREASMLNPVRIEEKVPAFAKMLKDRHEPQDWKELVKKTADMMIELGKKHLTENDFRSIEHPVMIGVGEKDNMVSIEESRNVAGQLPHAALEIFPGMQHAFEKVDHEILSSALKLFFYSKK
jgi:esterase